jgi:hypothetical protein
MLIEPDGDGANLYQSYESQDGSTRSNLRLFIAASALTGADYLASCNPVDIRLERLEPASIFIGSIFHERAKRRG